MYFIADGGRLRHGKLLVSPILWKQVGSAGGQDHKCKWPLSGGDCCRMPGKAECKDPTWVGCPGDSSWRELKEVSQWEFKVPAVCERIEKEKKGNSFRGFLLWVKNWMLINVH